MGKASRNKKERHMKPTGMPAVPMILPSKAKNPDPLSATLQELGGGNLIVIDGNGVAHGEAASRQMYWDEVCEGIRHRGAECLPEMAGLGSLMKLSILDVMVPVINFSNGKETTEEILTAMFLFGELGCFQWLLAHAGRHGCNWEAMGRLFKLVVEAMDFADEIDDEESPRTAVAKMTVRFMVEAFHREGVLERAMADGGSTMGQPFARRIGEDFLAEIAAKSERAELELVAAAGGDFEARVSRRI